MGRAAGPAAPVAALACGATDCQHMLRVSKHTCSKGIARCQNVRSGQHPCPPVTHTNECPACRGGVGLRMLCRSPTELRPDAQRTVPCLQGSCWIMRAATSTRCESCPRYPSTCGHVKRGAPNTQSVALMGLGCRAGGVAHATATAQPARMYACSRPLFPSKTCLNMAATHKCPCPHSPACLRWKTCGGGWSRSSPTSAPRWAGGARD